MRTISISFFVVAIISLTSQYSSGQCTPFYVFTGDFFGDQFGVSVSSAGDVNNDGYDDVIIGAMLNDAAGTQAGRAYVFSGQTGDTIYVFSGEAIDDFFGVSVSSAGDVNNDGYGDLIIGAFRNDAGGAHAGRAYVFSGQTGDTIYVFTGEDNFSSLGISVSSAGDVDSDGYDDVIVGAHGYGDAEGRAYIFSGQTGDTLYVYTGEAANDQLGVSVSSAGDVDNDGYDDFIIGANRNDAGGSNAGRAYVFSGKTGDTIHVFTGEAAEDLFGVSVSSAGDVNNDGYDDIIIGAYKNDVAGPNAGRAYVFSGLTGDTLYVFNGEAAGDQFGISVSSAGDVNNDGYDDIIIGANKNDYGGTDAGRAYLFSGQTGDTLYVFNGEADDRFGTSVSSAGDVDSNGNYDLIIGANLNDSGGPSAGAAYVFTDCVLSCCVGDRGDLNGDGTDANILDLTFAVDRIFRGGPASACIEEADVNDDGTPHNILDLTFLVDRIFRGGPAPGPC